MTEQLELPLADLFRSREAEWKEAWRMSGTRTPEMREELRMALSGPPSLPSEDAVRAEFIMADGLLDYFPNALAHIAAHSKKAGDKHHPGEPAHWERGKSTDHRNKIMRHLIDFDKDDAEGNLHAVALAWRALALAQEVLEERYKYPQPRNAV